MIDELVMFVNGDIEKTLDVQIDELEAVLTDYVATASDYVIVQSVNDATSGFSQEDVPISFKSNVEGTVRISANVRGAYTSSDFRIFVNGSRVASIDLTTSLQIVSADITIAKNDIITFSIYNKGYLAENCISVCGDIITRSQTNLIVQEAVS